MNTTTDTLDAAAVALLNRANTDDADVGAYRQAVVENSAYTELPGDWWDAVRAGRYSMFDEPERNTFYRALDRATVRLAMAIVVYRRHGDAAELVRAIGAYDLEKDNAWAEMTDFA